VGPPAADLGDESGARLARGGDRERHRAEPTCGADSSSRREVAAAVFSKSRLCGPSDLRVKLRVNEPRVNLVRICARTASVGHKMASMDNREKPSETLRQHAATYVDELIRLAPPCGRLTRYGPPSHDGACVYEQGHEDLSRPPLIM